LAKDFTHFDSHGNAIMVDVSAKEVTERIAEARGCISMGAEAMNAVMGGTVKKGDVLAVSRIAGIMAAKRCSELIPLCHPLNFDECIINFITDEKNNSIEASCRVKLSGKTGAEMEALTGVSVALLTIYDMCKALDRSMVIGNVRLWEKSGGKSGHVLREDSQRESSRRDSSRREELIGGTKRC
jgi:cyclic pyranopterin phosphate synthase